MALLVSTCLVSLIFRYPGTHEIGIDSFFIHALAQTIVQNGSAKWILNPISYFGWYPLSYPSGDPFLLASTSQLSGQDVETAVLLTSLLFGPIGILGSFLWARTFWTDEYFAIAVALVYGLAPRFLTFTLWTASTRNLFMAILPLFLWALMRLHRSARWSDFFITVVLLVSLAAVHRLAVLVILTAGGLLVAVILHIAAGIIRKYRPKAVLRGFVRGTARWVVFSAALTIGLGILLGSHVLDQYSRGELVSGSSTFIQFVNLGVSLVRSVGLALPLALVGFVSITRNRSLYVRHTFLIAALLGLIPTLLFRDYTGFYILPFLAAFAGYGFLAIFKVLHKHRRIATGTVVALAVALGVLSGYVLRYEIRVSTIMTEEDYTAAVYINQMQLEGALLANDGLAVSRIGALTGSRVVPTSGGFGVPGAEYLVFGYLSQDQVNSRIIRVPLAKITVDSETFWAVGGIDTVVDYATIMQSEFGKLPQALVERYHPIAYLESKTIYGSYYDYNRALHPSRLGNDLHALAYCTYDDGTETIWWLG